MNYSEHEHISTIADGMVKIDCAKCNRGYWVTKKLAKAIDKGKAENLCGYCDGSHDIEGDE